LAGKLPTTTLFGTSSAPTMMNAVGRSTTIPSIPPLLSPELTSFELL